MRNSVYNNAELLSSTEFPLWKSMSLDQIKSSPKQNTLSSRSDSDLVIGIDRTRVLFRAVALDSEIPAEFSLAADDQYSVRQQKIDTTDQWKKVA